MTQSRGDANALRILDRGVAAHAALRSLRMTYRVVETTETRTAETMRGIIVLARPGRARLEFAMSAPKGPVAVVPPPDSGKLPTPDAPVATPMRPASGRNPVVVSDGKKLTFALTAVGKIWSDDVEMNESAIHQTLDAPRVFEIGLINILDGRRPWGGDFADARVSADETIDGIPCDVIELMSGGKIGQPTPVRIAFAKSDGLLRRIRTDRVETPGANSEVTFGAVVRNPSVSPAEFKTSSQGLVRIPRGADWGESLKVGTPSPLLFATDRRGRTIDLDALRGSVVLVHFWGHFAPRSLWRLPDLVEVHARYGARTDFALVGINLDPRSKAQEIDRTLARFGVRWPQVHDGLGWESGPAKVWSIEGLPATFLIGRDGKLAAIDPVAPDLIPLVAKALSAAPRRR